MTATDLTVPNSPVPNSPVTDSPVTDSPVTHTVGAHLPERLVHATDQASRWSTTQDHWMPVTTAVVHDDVVVGAALSTARPGTGYRKIVDLAAETDEAFAELLAGVVAIGGAGTAAAGGIPAPIVVHVEERIANPFTPARADLLGAAGFVRQPQPLPSVPSTLETGASGARVWTRWATDAAPRPLPYYGQTTEVTCGAVTALDAIHATGRGGFTADRDDNHTIELGFWRQATNLPACEPIGLAVASREALGASAPAPRVVLSTGDPVLLEEFRASPGELRLREDLQAEARRRAAQLGVPIEERWMDVAEIAELVRSGHLVGILIDLMPLINDPSPHWILAYDVRGDHVIVSDPWVEAEAGESWADTYALPLPPETLDLIARWGDPVYRGVVVFPKAV